MNAEMLAGLALVARTPGIRLPPAMAGPLEAAELIVRCDDGGHTLTPAGLYEALAVGFPIGEFGDAGGLLNEEVLH